MSPGQLYRFGEFHLDAEQQLLFRGEEVVPLTPKAFETLLTLIENRGRMVSKEALLKQVWPDSFVEEGSLTRNISTLRKVLGDVGNGSTVIETIPKRGYRFVASVEVTHGNEVRGPKIPEPVEAVARQPRRWSRRWIAAIMVTAGVAALAVTAFVLRARVAPTGTDRTMLVVLPVENLTGDPEREYIADGLTEELIAELGALDPERLGVIARTSAMAYKSTNKTVDRIGKEVHAGYVVESSMRGGGGAMRITVQLVRAQDQTHVWAQSYDRNTSDLLLLESQIAQAVAHSIKLKLSDATQMRLTGANPVNPDVYDAYLKGRFYWNTRSREGLYKSIEYYNQVLQLDPVNARAYAGLADAYNMLVFYGFDPSRETKNKATVAARKALELDPNLAEAHAALAYANLFWWWEWADAERGFLRAIELDANYVPAHHWYALYLAVMGRRRESVEQMQKAMELDPLSPNVRAGSGFVHYFARQYDDAVTDSRAALEISPNSMAAHYVLGLAYEGKGDLAQAIPELQKAWTISNQQAPVYLGALGHAYAMAGKKAEATAILSQLEGMETPTRTLAASQAMVWAGLGDTEKEIDAMRRAGQGNDPQMIWLGVDPRWDSVRTRPAIQQLLSSLQPARPQ